MTEKSSKLFASYFFLGIATSVLGTFLYWIKQGKSQRNEGHRQSAAMKNITFLCEEHFKKHGHLPLGKNQTKDASIRIIGAKGKALFKNLSPFAANPDKFADYFSSGESLDRWGNPYRIYFDYDGDQLIQPFDSGTTFTERRVMVWSNGPDGKTGTPETEKDDFFN